MEWTAQQHQAIYEKGKNIIVSAGAGSGKTAVLSERVLQHILTDGYDVDRLLVVTFTEAAASSMKRKIRKTILNSDMDDEKKKTQLNKIDGSYIMTFDAYALSLVKKYHYLLGIDASVAVLDQSILNMKREEILDEILNEAYQKSEPHFVKLIQDFCVKDDKTVRANVCAIDDALNMMYERQEYVDAYMDKFYSPEGVKLGFKQYEQCVLDLQRKLNDLVNEISYDVPDYEKYIVGISAVCHAEGFDQLRSCEVNQKNYSAKNMGDDPEVKKLYSQIRETWKEIKELTAYSSDEYQAQYLLTKDYAQAYLELAQELNRRMWAYKRSINHYEFTDIFKMAIDIVAKFPTVREEIKEYFQEILIDEYQDTNDLQDLFVSYIGDNNVYMVGDIKQSIYRFRNANPDIFKEKYEEYKNPERGLKIDLLHNFRSRKEVLADINVIFENLMDVKIGGAAYQESHKMVNGNQDYNKPEKGENAQNHHTEFITYYDDKKLYPLSQYKKEEAEAFLVALDIKERIQNQELVYDPELGRQRVVEYRDFCILMDRRTSFDCYKEIFTSMGIPLNVDKRESTKDSDVLTIVKAIFQLLTDIANQDYGHSYRYHYASLARSFVVNMSDEDLYRALRRDELTKTELYQMLQTLSVGINTKTIGQIFDEAMDAFGVYEKIYSIGDVRANTVKLDYIEKMAGSLNQLGYTYQDFAEYLDHVFDSTDSIDFKMEKEVSNAVNIMTIHTSKGLEFTICYFTGLYKKFNRDDKKKNTIFTRNLGIVMPAMVEHKGLMETYMRYLFDRQYILEDISERIRVFYVALTRAREKMIMVGPWDMEKAAETPLSDEYRMGINSFMGMLNGVYHVMNNSSTGITQRIFPTVDEEGNPTEFLPPLPASNTYNIFQGITPEPKMIHIDHYVECKPEAIATGHFSKASGMVTPDVAKVMEFGTKMHYYMETLDFLNPDYSVMDAASERRARAFLASDLMKDVANGKAYKEYEFIYEVDGTLKHGFIDLLMEYDDHFDIIDYKLKNIDDEHYDEQLNGYRSYIESMSQKTVNCYLYSLMDSSYREVKK